MTSDASPPRRALVLGGGGSTGNAWLLGVLAGLADAGLDPTAADLVIGTSAGATTAAQVTAASPAGPVRRHRRGPGSSGCLRTAPRLRGRPPDGPNRRRHRGLHGPGRHAPPPGRGRPRAARLGRRGDPRAVARDRRLPVAHDPVARAAPAPDRGRGRHGRAGRVRPWQRCRDGRGGGRESARAASPSASASITTSTAATGRTPTMPTSRPAARECSFSPRTADGPARRRSGASTSWTRSPHWRPVAAGCGSSPPPRTSPVPGRWTCRCGRAPRAAGSSAGGPRPRPYGAFWG
ncbi:hypothetical protein [Nocardioides convexus]|uniref:hypothetical protein n=1 Tax=Nocardioides convexus TaxID=2712224 RepID=UPI00241856A9|nr:hypothetical protein [Nocardioides convexus]